MAPKRPNATFTAAGSDLGWIEVGYWRREHRTQIEWPSDDHKTPTWLGVTKLAGVPIARRVTVLFAQNSDEVVGVSLEDATPLRGSDLSRTAWARIIEVARTQRIKAIENRGSEHRADVQRLLGKIEPPQHPGRRGYGDDHYRLIGEWADELRNKGQTPARAIAESLHKPEETVRKWILEATKRGFARRGRSGRPPKREPT